MPLWFQSFICCKGGCGPCSRMYVLYILELRVFLLRKKLVRCVLGELPVRRDQRGHPFGIPIKSIHPCMLLIIEFAMQPRAIVLGGHPVCHWFQRRTGCTVIYAYDVLHKVQNS